MSHRLSPTSCLLSAVVRVTGPCPRQVRAARLVLLLALPAFATCVCGSDVQSGSPNSARALETPRVSPRVEDLGRAPRSNYGSLEATIQTLRAHRPLDLSAAEWRRKNP